MRPFGRHIDISHMFTGNHMGQRIRQVLMKLFFFLICIFFIYNDKHKNTNSVVIHKHNSTS